MTVEQKHRSEQGGLFELAKQLGDVSQAFKVFGYSHDIFYRFKELYEMGGRTGLPRNEPEASTDVERVLNSHPTVSEWAVVGVASPALKGDEEVKAILVLKEGMQLAPEDLLQCCETRLAYFAIPRSIEYQSSLPKTPTEKVQKHKLKEEGITTATWDRGKSRL